MRKSRSPRAAKKFRRRVTTVYMDQDVSKAARMKAAMTGMSVSDQVNHALLRDLREDEADLRVFRERAREPERDFEDFLLEMKRNGRL